MKILHICTYYIGNKLYKNLFQELSYRGFEQDVFIPVRSEEQVNLNKFESETYRVDFHYRHMLTKSDRFLFYRKTKRQIEEVERLVNVKENVEFIHAHTVFSDGATAYYLNKKYGTKYIVNVRNTDINFFWKYFIHLRPLMYKILMNAERIVFLSPAYQQQTLKKLPEAINMDIKDKCIAIPNGIEEAWFTTDRFPEVKKVDDELSLLFIGVLNENKNVGIVLKVVALLKSKGQTVIFNIIGDGPKLEEYQKMAKDLGIYEEVHFHGYMSAQDDILTIMKRSHIFVMPSITETFGLVYIEAMSTGLPVIYSEDQGIDGYYENGEVGYSVNPHQEQSIASAIQKIVANYDEMSQRCRIEAKKYNWPDIAAKYIEVYSGRFK